MCVIFNTHPSGFNIFVACPTVTLKAQRHDMPTEFWCVWEFASTSAQRSRERVPSAVSEMTRGE